MKPAEVRVTWLDAEDHPDTWVGEADAESFGKQDCTVVSLGYLISRTEKYITIAGDWNDTDKDWGRVTKIPASMLVSLENMT